MKNYKLSYTNRALMIFESLTDKPFEIKSLTDQYIFFYSVILANNKDIKLTFDEFVDLLDEEDNLKYLTDWLQEEIKFKSQFNTEKKTLNQNN